MLHIHSVETFGTHEGPGIRLVIFTQGCNFHCLYCQNPDTQVVNGGRVVTSKMILELLDKQKEYFSESGGLTFSGGEPLCQASDLLPICQEIKKAGYHITLDTNGSILSETVKKLYDVVDLVLLDIKHIDHNWHQKITGSGNQTVLKTAKHLESIKKSFWLRYVLVPDYSDQPEFLKKLGRHFQDFQMIERVEILPYHTLGRFKYDKLNWPYQLDDIPELKTQDIDKAKQIFEKYFPKVYIR